MAPSASRQAFIAPSSIIDPTAKIGSGTKVWAFCQVGEHAVIGSDCVLGNGTYVDRHVRIGNRVRVQNRALLYHGLVVEDDVFIGPAVVFTNDAWPRSGVIRDLRNVSWTVGQGASIGAHATILPDVNIGAHAMVGAGSVVTKDVPAYALVYGNPATLRGYVCACGGVRKAGAQSSKANCPKCGKRLNVTKAKNTTKK